MNRKIKIWIGVGACLLTTTGCMGASTTDESTSPTVEQSPAIESPAVEGGEGGEGGEGSEGGASSAEPSVRTFTPGGGESNSPDAAEDNAAQEAEGGEGGEGGEG